MILERVQYAGKNSQCKQTLVEIERICISQVEKCVESAHKLEDIRLVSQTAKDDLFITIVNYSYE